MKRNLPVTEREALAKLSALCARSEHCQGELRDKMRLWGLPPEVQERVLKRLTDGHFVDDERFCRAFIADKMTYNGWGRRKIEQALWAKHVDSSIYEPILDAVGDDEWLRILRPLLDSRRSSVKGDTAYERTARLVRFAMGRGFPMEIIRKAIDDKDF